SAGRVTADVKSAVSALEAIRYQVDELSATIEAPPGFLPTFGRSEQSGRPHVEVSANGAMHWVVCERGTEFERRTTFVRDELLYWVFDAVTFEMASRWELAHRKADEDFRKQMFLKQFQLLDALSPDWAERRKEDLGPLIHEAGL